MLPINENNPIATDWLNGRRTPDANQTLKGTISAIHLGTTAGMIFRSLVEATAYGSKAIIDRFKQEGVEIDKVIGIGGIALKSKFVMQTLSNVLNMPIEVCKTDQACALGAAMVAATAMNSGLAFKYLPIKENSIKYESLYKKYCEMCSFTETQTH